MYESSLTPVKAIIPNQCTKKRILGAAFFGLVTSSFITASLNFTIPRIIAVAQKIERDLAFEKYNSTIIWGMLAYSVAVLLGAGAAGYIAKRKGIIVGFLSHLIYMLLAAAALVIAIISQIDRLIYGVSLQLYLFLILLFTAGISMLGGWLGNRYYDEGNDLDLGKNKLTVFGIRWFHYIWMLPIIIYPVLVAFIYIIYGGILIFLADFYLAIHPSLWLNFIWWFYAAFIPILIMAAAWFGFTGIEKVLEIMQLGQLKIRGFKKIGQIVLFGIIFPAISSLISYLAITITHNMPRPTRGDWKIGISLILIIPIISGIVALVFWLKEKFWKKEVK